MSANLTSEQWDAVLEYRKAYGRLWKSRLRAAWENGSYGRFRYTNVEYLLQQVRNSHGSQWLNNVRISKVSA